MKANKFLSKLLENWPAKIICFTIAVFLYLFYQLSQVETFNVNIPLTVINEGNVELVSTQGNITNVKVVVKAKNNTVSHSQGDNLKASININYLTDSGEYEVPVILSVNEELLSLDPLEIKVVPEEVKVKVEKKMFNGVPVVPTISGIPQHGYEITSCKVTPELVPVTGPESVIKKTSQLVTEMIDVTDIRSSKVYKAKVKNMNKLIKPEEEVEYEVEVTVEPIIMERKFEGVPVRFINLAPSLVVTTPTPAVDFTLQGPMPLLEKYVTNLDTVKIDLSAVSDAGVYALPVIFNLPKDSVIIGQNDFVFEISVANKELEDKEVILEEGTVL